MFAIQIHTIFLECIMFSRLFFISLSLNCNIDSDKPRTVIFKSDADFIAFMRLFAGTKI